MIRDYELDTELFKGMPLTFQGNEVGKIVGVNKHTGIINFYTDNQYIQGLLSSGAEFTLEVKVKK